MLVAHCIHRNSLHLAAHAHSTHTLNNEKKIVCSAFYARTDGHSQTVVKQAGKDCTHICKKTHASKKPVPNFCTGSNDTTAVKFGVHYSSVRAGQQIFSVHKISQMTNNYVHVCVHQHSNNLFFSQWTFKFSMKHMLKNLENMPWPL